jgi:hypothetical protein
LHAPKALIFFTARRLVADSSSSPLTPLYFPPGRRTKSSVVRFITKSSEKLKLLPQHHLPIIDTLVLDSSLLSAPARPSCLTPASTVALGTSPSPLLSRQPPLVPSVTTLGSPLERGHRAGKLPKISIVALVNPRTICGDFCR